MSGTESSSADELLAKQLSALAHPLRLQIMRAACLRENPACTALEASRALRTSLPLISYHARILRDAGMLTTVELVHRRGAVQHRYEPTNRGERLMLMLASFDESAPDGALPIGR
jgi:DNA-binding transcriptional ArsR family regulator